MKYTILARDYNDVVWRKTNFSYIQLKLALIFVQTKQEMVIESTMYSIIEEK